MKPEVYRAITSAQIQLNVAKQIRKQCLFLITKKWDIQGSSQPNICLLFIYWNKTEGRETPKGTETEGVTYQERKPSFKYVSGFKAISNNWLQKWVRRRPWWYFLQLSRFGFWDMSSESELVDEVERHRLVASPHCMAWILIERGWTPIWICPQWEVAGRGRCPCILSVCCL